MSHRLTLGFTFACLLSSACLADAPPKAAASPGAAQSGSGECGQFKIQSGSDLEGCKQKCQDQQRDQMKSCSGPGCQAGSATSVCLGTCDDGQKSARQAKCFKD